MSLVRFSSNEVPETERTSRYSDVLNSVFKLDLANHGDSPIDVSAHLRRLPGGIVVASSTFSPISMVRAAVHVADGNDDLVLSVPLKGRAAYRQRGRTETECDPGGAYLLLNERTSEIRNGKMSRLSLAIPQAALAPVLGNLDAALRGGIPPGPALSLLVDYVQSLTRSDGDLPPELERLAATHVCDLVALVIGASVDAAALARGRGAQAARIRAVKADIAASLRDPSLSVDRIARRHGISVRRLQALLKGEGTTFRDFLLAERLERARRMLADVVNDEVPVSRIAFACSFGDLSHFNQTFRRRFGMTPSDLRRSAREAR
jgi:AraC-like DNA-binding protein